MIFGNSRRILSVVFPTVLLLLPTQPAWSQSGGGVSADAAPQVGEPKKEKYQCEVLFITRETITVRDRVNYNLLRTFTYGQKLSGKIARMFDKQQIYQYGDKVVISYLSGTKTAIDIDGKPSLPPYR